MTEREAAVLTIVADTLDAHFQKLSHTWSGDVETLLSGYKEIGKLLADDLPEGMK